MLFYENLLCALEYVIFLFVAGLIFIALFSKGELGDFPIALMLAFRSWLNEQGEAVRMRKIRWDFETVAARVRSFDVALKARLERIKDSLDDFSRRPAPSAALRLSSYVGAWALPRAAWGLDAITAICVMLIVCPKQYIAALRLWSK